MKIPELLAPAGNFETLEAAFISGADAVYLGMGVLNLRAFSDNFTLADLPDIMDIARRFQGKIYVVLNIMPNDAELRAVSQFLKKLARTAIVPHALIVSDPGVICLCKDMVPHIPLHLSTQTGTFNMESMRFWTRQGISRIVLPREFSRKQVADCAQAKICETEIFVHGAMCVSISGRCLMGAYINGRHPNHGECSQPCRLPYDVFPRSKKGTAEFSGFSIEENSHGAYIFNAKDLNTLSILPGIVSLGVDSLKIEGRNKSVNYISTVVSAYAAVLTAVTEGLCDSVDIKRVQELESLDHRPYTTGFIGGDTQMQEISFAKQKSRIRVLGRVKDILAGGLAVVDVKNPFWRGEEISVLSVNQKKGSRDVPVSCIRDLSGNELEKAVTNRLVTIETDHAYSLRVGDMLRRFI
ncbi:MAG: peptidase U32 family protein [Fibrobacterota bacterium]